MNMNPEREYLSEETKTELSEQVLSLFQANKAQCSDTIEMLVKLTASMTMATAVCNPEVRADPQQLPAKLVTLYNLITSMLKSEITAMMTAPIPPNTTLN
jgi:hypothetical protein